MFETETEAGGGRLRTCAGMLSISPVKTVNGVGQGGSTAESQGSAASGVMWGSGDSGSPDPAGLCTQFQESRILL